MFCPHCGFQNEQTNLYCENCGALLRHAEENTAPPMGEYCGLSEDEKNFIGKNVEYYAAKFANLRGGGKVSWNWCAFLVFPHWAIYRKMYKESILYLAASWVLGVLLHGFYPSLILCVLGGLFGNWLYLRVISDAIIEAEGMPSLEKNAYYDKFGGVSSRNVWILIAITAAINVALTLLTSMFFGFVSILH
ncbi:MAG: zinc ribbon domain-containing protein [Pygmaiobacter sp.]